MHRDLQVMNFCQRQLIAHTCYLVTHIRALSPDITLNIQLNNAIYPRPESTLFNLPLAHA